jgi:hypothetical protein
VSDLQKTVTTLKLEIHCSVTIVLASTSEYARLYILFVTASMETESIVVDFVHAAEWRPKLTPKSHFAT